MTTPTDQRATGTCNHCQHRTTDGIVQLVEQGTRGGGTVLVCADYKACKKRRGGRPE